MRPSLIFATLWVFTSLTSVNAQTYHQKIVDSWNDSMDIRQSNSRFEIYDLTIFRGSDVTKIIIDSSVPLDGISDVGAKDGLISWGDIFITPTDKDNYSEIGVVFNPASKIGIYSEMNKVSLVEDNFGNKDNYGQITSIQPTSDPVGMLEVEYFEGLGINNSNRIVLSMPSSSIPFSSGMLKLAIECYNDFVQSNFTIDIPPPQPPVEVTPPEKLPDVPNIIEVTPVTLPTTELTNSSDVLPIAVGAGILVLVLLLLLNNGNDNDRKIITEIPKKPDDETKNPDKQEIPENSYLFGLLLISGILVNGLRNKAIVARKP